MSHYRLFTRLIKAGLPKCIIDVLVNWYSKLTSAVKWNTCISRWFIVCNDARQGGVLSPVLFTVFANMFIDEIRASGLGCYILDMFMGCIMYADDVCCLVV